MQLEEWDKQLHRSQQNMRELAGSDPNTVLDFGLVGSDEETQSETASQAQGAQACHPYSGVEKAVSYRAGWS